jgi:hypothetical protein
VSDDLERRLRDSLRAYAETVDAPDDESHPLQPVAERPVRRWRGAVLAAAAAAVVATGSVWVISAQRDGTDSGATSAVVRVDAPASTSPAAPSPSGTAADSAQALAAVPGAAVPYVLYTHCGVRGADVGGVWFAATPPLVEDDGPPAGWGNPDQSGTLTLLSATAAVFTDDRGHEVSLRADESARPPLCD